MSTARFFARAGAIGCAVSVGLTWPLVAHLRTHVLDDGTFDAFQFTWNVWWVGEALLAFHTHPFHTPLLFHPTGVPLLFHTGAFALGLLALPLRFVFPHDPVAVHNCLVLAAPGLTVVAVALLAREVGAGPWAAIAGGVAAAVTPSTTWFVPVLYLSCGWLLALLVWAWWRMQRRRRPGGVALALLLLALLVFASQEYAVMGLALLGLDTVVRTVLADRLGIPATWRGGTAAFWGLATAGLGALSFLASANPAQLPPPSHVAVGSGWLLGLVTPPWLVPPPVAFFGVLFLGTVPMLLALSAALLDRRRGGVWLVSLGAMLVMVLGPRLRVRSPFAALPSPDAPYVPTGLPGPYMLLAWLLPILRYFRAPYRWMTAAHVALGVLVALGIDGIRARLHGPAARAVAGAMAFVAILAGAALDSRGLRAPLVSAAVPPGYDAIRADRGRGAVLDVPAGFAGSGFTPFASRYMYWQTAHHHPIYDGTVSRLPPGMQPVILRPFTSLAELTALPDLAWVVVHRDLLEQAHPYGRDHAARIVGMLPQIADVVSDDGTTQVWRVRPLPGVSGG